MNAGGVVGTAASTRARPGAARGRGAARRPSRDRARRGRRRRLEQVAARAKAEIPFRIERRAGSGLGDEAASRRGEVSTPTPPAQRPTTSVPRGRARRPEHGDPLGRDGEGGGPAGDPPLPLGRPDPVEAERVRAATETRREHQVAASGLLGQLAPGGVRWSSPGSRPPPGGHHQLRPVTSSSKRTSSARPSSSMHERAHGLADRARCVTLIGSSTTSVPGRQSGRRVTTSPRGSTSAASPGNSSSPLDPD